MRLGAIEICATRDEIVIPPLKDLRSSRPDHMGDGVYMELDVASHLGDVVRRVLEKA